VKRGGRVSRSSSPPQGWLPHQCDQRGPGVRRRRLLRLHAWAGGPSRLCVHLCARRCDNPPTSPLSPLLVRQRATQDNHRLFREFQAFLISRPKSSITHPQLGPKARHISGSQREPRQVYNLVFLSIFQDERLSTMRVSQAGIKTVAHQHKQSMIWISIEVCRL
jgi:hypothetical protein